MPYKYIGRRTDFKGKPLWEIVGNLKDYGIGRLFTKGMYKRYPEPTYYKILKVETFANPLNPSMDNVRLVKVVVESTFRGRRLPEPEVFDETSYKADFQLIPKDEEAEFCKYEAKPEPERIFPRTMDFPPLLKEIIMRESTSKETPKLEIAYNANFKHKIAKDGEVPNVEVTPALGKPASPVLYDNLKL